MPDLFVFEGGDACGKATQAKLLAETLSTRVVSFPRYEVGATGSIIKDILHERMSLTQTGTGDMKKMEGAPDRRLLQAFMTWDRYTCRDLWDAPESRLVLDRYWMSGCVYGALDGIPLEELLQAHRGLPTPEIAFLMDLPVEVQMQRLEARGRVPDRYEAKEGLRERLETIRGLYLGIWKIHGPVMCPKTRWVIIDATANVEAIKAQILTQTPVTLLKFARDPMAVVP